jgi:hypothetical protein
MLDLRRRQFITLLGGPPRTYMHAKSIDVTLTVHANRRHSTVLTKSLREGHRYRKVAKIH